MTFLEVNEDLCMMPVIGLMELFESDQIDIVPSDRADINICRKSA